MQGETDFLVSAYAAGRDFKHRVFCLLELNDPTTSCVFFQRLSHKDKPLRFSASESWSNVHAGLKISLTCWRKKKKIATFLGVSEVSYPEQPSMTTLYLSIT